MNKKKTNIITIVAYIFVAALVFVAIMAIIQGVSNKNRSSSSFSLKSQSVNTDNTSSDGNSTAPAADDTKDTTESNDTSSTNDSSESASDNDNVHDFDDKPLTEYEEDADSEIEIPFDVFTEE